MVAACADNAGGADKSCVWDWARPGQPIIKQHNKITIPNGSTVNPHLTIKPRKRATAFLRTQGAKILLALSKSQT
jgi:hypothetical protein